MNNNKYIAAQGNCMSVIRFIETLIIAHSLSVNMYIQTGPLPNTLDDFWRMIWENRLPTIIMLTKCFEDRVLCNV